MKRFFCLLFFMLIISGCGTDKTRVKVLERADDLYLAEPVFAEDFPCPGTSGTAEWIQGETSYFLIADTNNNYSALSIDEYGKNSFKTIELNMEQRHLIVSMQGFVDADGFLHVLCKGEEKNESGLETGFFLCTFDTQGICVNEVDCTDAIIRAGAYNRNGFLGNMLSDGRLLFFVVNLEGKTSMVILSAEGKLLEEKEIVGINASENSIRGILLCEENNMLTLEYNGKNDKYVIGQIDAKTGKRDILVSGIMVETMGGCTLKKYDGKNIVYFETADAVWECNLKEKTLQMIFAYEDFGLAANEAGGAVLLEDGTWCFTRYQRRDDKETCNYIHLIKTEERLIRKEKIILTLAVSNPRELYANDVNAFNLSRNDVKIDIKIYENDESFAKDLMTGNIPDLVDVELSEVYDLMVKKDLLQDLSSYFKKDKELSKEDFLPKALELYSLGDKLFAVPYGIQLYGLMGDAEYFKGKDCWTLNEFIAFLQDVPDPKKLTSGISNLEFLCDLSYYNLDNFVDASAGKCDFLQEGYLELLECAKQFPEYDVGNASLDALLDDVLSGNTALLSVRLADIEDYEYWRTLFSGKGKLMGFPTSDGGNVCIGGCGFAYAMTSTCSHKDEAWEFIKYAMTHEKENMETHRFPSYKPLYDELIKKERKEADDNGKPGQTYVCGLTLEIPPADRAEIDMLEGYLETGRVITQRNEKIVRIMAEEAQYYFNNLVTAREAAEAIQKRVELYLKEQYN